MSRLRVYALPGCILLLIVVTLLSAACGRSGGRDKTVILVSTAVSLRESLEEIARQYQKDHPGIEIQLNYGSSGALQKQIEQGAPADLFLSAGRKQMDALIGRNLVKQSRNVLSNRLVLIVPTSSADLPNHIEDLRSPKTGKIAIGQPDTVPAGIYARQSLTSLRVWDNLQPKLVYAQDVRQVMAYVETGNADAGIVYLTDARASRKVKIAFDIPVGSHDPIVYPFALLTGAQNPDEAAGFYRYLSAGQAMAVFAKNGFLKP